MLLKSAEIYTWKPLGPCRVALYLASVPAGFPSPADDYIETSLDLNEYLIKHQAATFFVRARGSSMIGAGIRDGDLLVVDRAVDPKNGSVVIAAVCGDLTVKRISRRDGKLLLCPDNECFTPIEVTPEAEFQIWGVVTHAIHRV